MHGHTTRGLRFATAVGLVTLLAPNAIASEPCPPGWSPVLGPANGMNGTVHSLLSFDEGSGMQLYAGGEFTVAGGTAANRIARWNGTVWSPLGLGMIGNTVFALAPFEGQLHAAGRFATADGQPANRTARWDGRAWWPLGAGFGTRWIGVGGVLHASSASKPRVTG